MTWKARKCVMRVEEMVQMFEPEGFSYNAVDFDDSDNRQVDLATYDQTKRAESARTSPFLNQFMISCIVSLWNRYNSASFPKRDCTFAPMQPVVALF